MNKRELEKKRIDILEELDSNLTGAITELNSLNKDLEELHNLVESLEERYEELPEEEKQGLSEALQRTVSELNDVESPSRLLSFESEIQEAYENPIIESVQANVLDFYKIIEYEISENEKKELLQKINVEAQSDIREAQKATTDLPERAQGLPDPAKEAIKKEISSRPSTVSDPDLLDELIDAIEERHQTLQQISEQFDTVDWSSEEFAEITNFVEYYKVRKDVDPLLGFAQDVDDIISNIPPVVPIRAVITAHLEGNLDKFRRSPEQSVEEVNELLDRIVNRREKLEKIEELLDVVDPDQTEIEFLSTIKELESEPPENLIILSEVINEICNKFDKWADDVANRWETLQPVIRTYETKLGLSPPEPVSEFSNQKLPLSNQVATAYSAYLRAESWIDAKQDDVLDQVSEEAQEVFLELSSEGEVEVSEANLDLIKELIGIVDLKIVIDE